MTSLAALPSELLENVAFFAATDNFVGPPSGILPLLALDRRTNNILAFSTNPHLWARIFACKFDLAPVVRRMGADFAAPSAVAHELKTRCVLLRRMRDREGALTTSLDLEHHRAQSLSDMLWMAYLMMLENDGNNERQLREYGLVDDWLREYLFRPSGASLIPWSIWMDQWPDDDNVQNALVMWLFWFLLKPDEYMRDNAMFRDATNALKIVASGAHMYPLCIPSWRDFIPSERLKEPIQVPHFSSTLRITPPTPAPPAILAYLALVNKLRVSWDMLSYMKPPDPTIPSAVPVRDSREWDAEWARGLHLGSHNAQPFGSELSGAFIPGSLEGVWEGLFTYTDFAAYAALLSGASPAVLQRSRVAQHPHLWKVREYHLLAPTEDEHGAPRAPLAPGSPLRGYVSMNADVRESSAGLEISEPGRREPVVYARYAGAAQQGRTVRDVILVGEGHSSWGQFNLLGRVRPCDGLISLSKEYVDGDRGTWVYRGYMVGNVNGNLAGRWRDTLSPADVPGYEGCFIMSRRR
ncbi:hypothetical protein B0H21DRAFT_709738 [Amylocystis lapponica]|nr:hypothetical protein B0H21DRAFT_709738 [Amylocystis lapponica]